MAGTELGKAWVQIVPSAKGISGSIQKVLDPEATAAGTSSGNKIVSTLKKVIAGAGLGAALKKTLDIGAELEQNLGGTVAVFDKYAEHIQNTAKTAYMNMGLSASDYMATANKMASLFYGSGVEQSKAVQLTTDAMQRAADVASVMGIDMQWAMDSIANAAKGNFTMMDNLGVKMNATAISAYALEKGINFDWNTASEAEKAELAIQMFMERTKYAAGNFADESEHTFSGSIGAMKAAAQDLMGNLMLGTNVTTSMQNLAKTITTFVGGNLIPSVGRILGGLPATVMTALDELVPAVTDGLTNAAAVIQERFPEMLSSALEGLLDFSSNIREKAGGLVDAGLGLVKNIASGIIQNIPTIVETVPTIISNFAGIINDNAPKILTTGVQIIWSLVKGLIQAIPVIVANLPKIIAAIWDVFTAVNWINLGSTVINAIGSGVAKMAANIPNSLKNIAIEALHAFESINWGNLGLSIVELIGSGIKTLANFVPNLLKSIARTGMKWFTGIAWGNVGSTIMSNIASGITAAISTIKTAVEDVIKKIKSYFPFNIGKIFSGWVPKISLKTTKDKDSASTSSSTSKEYFAKAMSQPYMFKHPTEFYAGEAGDEILYGRSSFIEDIKDAVNSVSKDTSYSERPIVVSIQLDGKEIARATAPYMDTEINRLQTRANRKLGYI